MKKKFALMGLMAGFTILSTIPAFAGQWKQDSTGWWYQNDDGSYPTSTWNWIDGNNDGIAESYYFNSNGYIAVNTTVDGYTVNNDGAWTVNGIVQTKQVTADNTTTQTSQSGGAGSTNQQAGSGSQQTSNSNILGENGWNPFAGGGGGKITGLDYEAAARGHMY